MATPARGQRGRDELSTTLRRLRTHAGLTGRAAAQAAGPGVSQSKISKYENGMLMPTVEAVRALCRVYNADADTRRHLEALTRDLKAETTTRQVVLRRGAWRQQARIRRMYEASARVRSFQPAMVLGLLQTPDYARAVFTDSGELDEAEIEAAAEQRAASQPLLGTDRGFTLIMTEGALRWHAVSPQVMAGQLDRIVEASRLPNVHIGVIGWTRPVATFPLHPFHIYDSRAVTIGTLIAMAVVTEARDVAVYEKQFTELENAADFGDAARAHLARIAADYRALS